MRASDFAGWTPEGLELLRRVLVEAKAAKERLK